MTEAETLPKPICTGCDKHPDELEEYIEAAAENDMTPDEYVRDQEGTYNPETGHFLCTGCYVDSGMPSARHGWKAP